MRIDAGVLQVRDELVKLPDVLFGEKEVAASLHPSLEGQLDRTQALAVRALVQHGPVMDFASTVEGKPERGRSHAVVRVQQLLFCPPALAHLLFAWQPASAPDPGEESDGRDSSPERYRT